MSEVSSPFHPIVLGALYTGIERGLAADLLATRALGGAAYPVCTSIVVASRGLVTDVVDVPTDSVDAQLEHLFKTTQPSAVKLGIVPNRKTVEAVFRRVVPPSGDGAALPLLLDLTLSGPSGEDITGERGMQALMDHLSVPDLVTLRRADAELVAAMEISTLDDAQVAVQRLAKRGARRVLLRCGRIPSRHFDGGQTSDFALDLYYDGDDFGLFEAPYLRLSDVHGASSLLTMAILRGLVRQRPMTAAIQAAKAFVSEALRFRRAGEPGGVPYYFWELKQGPKASPR